ncbi:hypothetical protein L9F63_024731, partial [Diploptera punctata]
VYEGIASHITHCKVKSAYRKKALTCHPDKNPDNPKAVQLFHQLSRALEVLIDESARAAYDKVLNAKKAAKLRNRELDSKRRKLKEELEARERLADKSTKVKTDEEKLQAEIERLRKEGSKQLEEEQEYVRQQIISQRLNPEKSDIEDSTSNNRLRVRWEAAKSDPSNGGYNSEVLHRIFYKATQVSTILLTKRQKGSALVEFKTKEAAAMALELERGLATNPLILETLDLEQKQKTASRKNKGPSLADINTGTKFTNSLSGSPQSLETDYESVVLHRMRQAQERKRLTEQMMKEEKEEPYH